ncbi:hypothetical protein [Phytohalomonas tamaricis]|uniref:hypothetical protein n=1 Tax=Phytohalomonas tamaricis TaxID=2081032 RepID=UPI000D0BC1EC|nr:hypothetical protein [Phytohalomonas tamaricis]
MVLGRTELNKASTNIKQLPAYSVGGGSTQTALILILYTWIAEAAALFPAVWRVEVLAIVLIASPATVP